MIDYVSKYRPHDPIFAKKLEIHAIVVVEK